MYLVLLIKQKVKLPVVFNKCMSKVIIFQQNEQSVDKINWDST